MSVNVYVLGANGMMGSMFLRIRDRMPGIRVTGIYRDEFEIPRDDVVKLDDIVGEKKSVVYIINFIGCIPQKNYKDEEYVEINEKFPHVLSKFCERRGWIYIHMSTNCVFSGKYPNARDTDVPDAHDIYGLTKARGEPTYGIIFRTSIIGPENGTSYGLMSWFLNTTSDVRGYLSHLWNGVTTLEMSYVIYEVIMEYPNLRNKIIHVASECIVSKYELLLHIKKIFGHDPSLNIIPDDSVPKKYYTLEPTVGLRRRSPPVNENVLRLRKSIVEQLDELFFEK